MRSVFLVTFGLTVAALVLPDRIRADNYPRQEGVDVQHYRFEVGLSDDEDRISGRAQVDVRFDHSGISTFWLDLVNATTARLGKGMTVASVTQDGEAVVFTHEADRLHIMMHSPSKAGQLVKFSVEYGGEPADALVIGPNKHGDRTFFSDNWPNGVRNWLPTVDHPSDKATMEMVVTAPVHYQVVSNGLLVEETDLDGFRLTHWRQSVPISTWLFALGVAPFAVDYYGEFKGRSVQTWVYRQDRDAGFYDFAEPTIDVLEFYDSQVGPFAYEKLANIQSNSVGGGMEAATAIFYGDDSVTGERTERWRNVIIHEIAHQWFGNAVTESDWNDVWLSEGFATYFTLLYREHAYGRDDFVAGLMSSRDRILSFDAERPDYRVRHENLTDMGEVTTSQTYQKGAWILHMLRGLIGDDAFWSGIRAYYRTYMNRTATTEDFVKVMEEASGQDLKLFFSEWLDRGGMIDLEISWQFKALDNTVILGLKQNGQPYHLPVEIAIMTETGEIGRYKIDLSGTKQQVVLPVSSRPASIVVDPDHWLLNRASIVNQ